MEVDTGASASVISEATYQQLWPETPPVLHPSAIKFRTYTGKALKILGSTTVAVKYQGQTAKLPLLIIKAAGPSLLGKDGYPVSAFHGNSCYIKFRLILPTSNIF